MNAGQIFAKKKHLPISLPFIPPERNGPEIMLSQIIRHAYIIYKYLIILILRRVFSTFVAGGEEETPLNQPKIS